MPRRRSRKRSSAVARPSTAIVPYAPRVVERVSRPVVVVSRRSDGDGRARFTPRVIKPILAGAAGIAAGGLGGAALQSAGWSPTAASAVVLVGGGLVAWYTRGSLRTAALSAAATGAGALLLGRTPGAPPGSSAGPGDPWWKNILRWGVGVGPWSPFASAPAGAPPVQQTSYTSSSTTTRSV